MSGNFAFPPPPPPPPPSSTASNFHDKYGSQHRGGQRGVRSGPSDDRERMRGGPNQNRGLFSGSNNNSSHGIHQNGPNHRNRQLHVPQAPSNQPVSQPWMRNSPPERTVNSTFGEWEDPNPTHTLPPHADTASVQPYSGPPRTFAGHKRKLNALRPSAEGRRDSGPQTAPAVPGFGAPILVPTPNGAFQSKQTHRTNALGLTPSTAHPQYSSSDEDVDDKEVDEEAMHIELGAKLTFEHNGVIMSLNSAADLAAWREERRRKWPTMRRMVEREMQKKRTGEERRRLLASANALESVYVAKMRNSHKNSISGPPLKDGSVSAKIIAPSDKDSTGPKTKLDTARTELAAQEKKLDALRKRVAQGQATLEKMQAEQQLRDERHTDELLDQPAGDKADQEKDDDDSDASTVLSESSLLTSDTGEEDEVSDDDAPPEESSSKVLPVPTVPSQRPPCRYYYASGYCRDGDTCRFKHELSHGAKQRAMAQQQPFKAPLPSKGTETLKARKGIYEILMGRQREEEDKLALQVIKHLGKAGFFNAEIRREEV